MTQTAKALYEFASMFGWNAYPEYSVPTNAKLPYITYTLQEYEWDHMGTMQIRLWSENTSYTEINKKIDEISDYLKNGAEIKTDSGKLVFYKDDPFCQYQPSDEVNLKIAYMLIKVHYLTK